MCFKILKKNNLSTQEIDRICEIYISSYYVEQTLTKETLMFVRKSIASNIFTWHLVIYEEKNVETKNGTGNEQIIGIASYVSVNYENNNFVEHNLSVHPLELNVNLGENVTNIAIDNDHRGKGYAKLLLQSIIDNTTGPLVLEIKKTSIHYNQLFKLYTSFGFREFSQETEAGVFLRLNR